MIRIGLGWVGLGWVVLCWGVPSCCGVWLRPNWSRRGVRPTPLKPDAIAVVVVEEREEEAVSKR